MSKANDKKQNTSPGFILLSEEEIKSFFTYLTQKTSISFILVVHALILKHLSLLWKTLIHLAHSSEAYFLHGIVRQVSSYLSIQTDQLPLMILQH